MSQKKISVIIPCYNVSMFLDRCMESLEKQTIGIENLEIILINDASKDATLGKILLWEMKYPDNIIVIPLEENVMQGAARNIARGYCSAEYIAYLDADDLWTPDKLEKQVRFMKDGGYGFSCTSYEVIDNEGNKLNKLVHMLPKVDYVGFLTNNLLQTVGIMVDTQIVDKKHLVMPDIRRRQDAATWLQILKAGHDCYGLDEILAQYRRAANSLSSNKFKAVKGVWHLYRDIEHLPLMFSCYCFVRYAFLAVWKRIYVRR